MKVTTVRRKRLEQLLNLAQTYKGCSRKQLAKALGRDPTKLVPKLGVPKLDLVVELADVLDWPVGEVATFLWARQSSSTAAGHDEDFDSLNRSAGEAHRCGRYRLMLDLARRALAVAETPDQRARACNRQVGAWDGLGRYMDVLQACKQGLQEQGVAPESRRQLQSNLANAYYSLWSLVESGAIAQNLLSWYRENPPRSATDRKTNAFAYYVSGHTLRRLISVDARQRTVLAEAAAADLRQGRARSTELAEQLDDPSFAGIARTCHGGLIETDVALGRRRPQDGLAELAAGLDNVRDVSSELVGDQLESYGWWCIFGCNIALQHLDDERALQKHMAVFMNKADEIADRLDNWPMRERVFTMQYKRWERAVNVSGLDIPCVIDSDDVRVITGTMGRFPTFRETGWRILQSAQVVEGNE